MWEVDPLNGRWWRHTLMQDETDVFSVGKREVVQSDGSGCLGSQWNLGFSVELKAGSSLDFVGTGFGIQFSQGFSYQTSTRVRCSHGRPGAGSEYCRAYSWKVIFVVTGCQFRLIDCQEVPQELSKQWVPLKSWKAPLLAPAHLRA